MRLEAGLRTLAGYSTRTAGRAERLAGRLRASLEYAQVDEILSEDPQAYLLSINVSYPIESALPA